MPMTTCAEENLRRLLNPRHIAVFGGAAAEEAIRQCRKVGFEADIWPVHPTRPSIGGLPCYRHATSLPAAPDAAFVAVPMESTVEVVADLAELGAGGVVCHASGFAEDGPGGEARQRDLVAAAGDMALIGPNCIGILNYLDGAALWADQQGGHRVDRGVAVITQSGNIGQNLTMQRRSLPLAQMITVGNGAVTGVAELVEAIVDDPRISAIGLHLEGVEDVARLSRAALAALRKRVPIVVLKSGSSELGARANLGHTSSLAGSDVMCDALFRRLGMARVHELGTFLETLKFLHVHGAVPGTRIASASCSGGEAALVADLAQERGIELPPFPDDTQRRLQSVLGERVSVANPLDYHTYIWGDFEAQRECFAEFLNAGFDLHVLLLDFPREDRCDQGSWWTTVDAYVAAHARTSAPACVVSSLPEGVPEVVGDRLLSEKIAPMQGLAECLEAVAAARRIGAAQDAVEGIAPLEAVAAPDAGSTHQLDEWTGKQVLAEWGVPVPVGVVVSADDAEQAAEELGYPVVAKVVSTSIAHKSDVGGVHIGLADAQQVRAAVAEMSGLSGRFLVERLVGGAVAELIVGVHHDPQFGMAVTIGAGGVLVELVGDAVTLLLPTTRAEIRSALRSLRVWPLLTGFRGRAPGDVDAVVEAVATIAEGARSTTGGLVELDVNPLFVLPDRDGVVAIDALITLNSEAAHEQERRRTALLASPGRTRDRGGSDA